MTISDLRCDLCGASLAGSAMLNPSDPRAAVRLYFHPGDATIRDDTTLVCVRCFEAFAGMHGTEGPENRCAACGAEVAFDNSLHVLHMTGRIGEAPGWQFCREHAVAFLNSLRHTEPKLGPEDLKLKADFSPNRRPSP